jgi:hypothetical protein
MTVVFPKTPMIIARILNATDGRRINVGIESIESVVFAIIFIS